MADGIAREGFDLDLGYGRERELAFADILYIRGGQYVEIKSDQRSVSTGNVFVEFRQHGRPSGIATTAAQWWTVEVLPNVFVTMSTERMKALARLALKQGRRTQGGDNNAYTGALVPVRWLIEPWQKAE